MGDDLEPAAYRAKYQYSPGEHLFRERKGQLPVRVDDEEVDELFAAEDIIQLIEEQIERHEDEHQEVHECNIDDCPYDMDTDEHIDEELMIVGRKQSLKALKSRISSQEVDT